MDNGVRLVLVTLSSLIRGAVLRHLLYNRPPTHLRGVGGVVCLFITLNHVRIHRCRVGLIILRLILLRLVSRLLSLIDIVLPPNVRPITRLIRRRRAVSKGTRLFHARYNGDDQAYRRPVRMNNRISVVGGLLASVRPIVGHASREKSTSVSELTFRTYRLVTSVLLKMTPATGMIVCIRIVNRVAFLVTVLRCALCVWGCLVCSAGRKRGTYVNNRRNASAPKERNVKCDVYKNGRKVQTIA